MCKLIDWAERIDNEAEAFLSLEVVPFEKGLGAGKASGIYALFESDQPVYVGRTRNLAQRFRAHVSVSHTSASFALKRTRAIHGLQATYRSEGSRKHIASTSPTRETFLKEIEKIRQMKYRFKQVSDPVDQYLLELAVTLRFRLSLDGFDSH